MENFSKTTYLEEKNSLNKKNSTFVDILCPLTKNKLISNSCLNCEYVQRIEYKHSSGRTLSTLICLFGINNEGE